MPDTRPRKKRRGTVIVERSGSVLLTETRAGMLLLPGGGAERNESRFEAAIRELREETGLIARQALVLFEHPSRTNAHKVVWVCAPGIPQPMDDAVALHYFKPDSIELVTSMSPATRKIIHRFWDYKAQHADLFHMLENHDIVT